MYKSITIKDIDKPRSDKIPDEVKWICDSLDLISGRDTQDMSFKIFYELLSSLKIEERVSSEEIATKLDIEPSRVNHHIRCLMSSGIIYRQKRKIVLRGGNLSAAIQELKRDSEQMFDDLIEFSNKIDKQMGLE